MSEESTDLLIVTEEEIGERLDKILAKRFKEVYSRTYFQNLIDEQLVLLNGLPVKKRIKPQEGDEIEVEFAASPEIDLSPEPIPLDIIYEDEHLLAVNKPAGMVVHPAPGHWNGTFVNALLYHCGSLPKTEEQSLRPGIVHRLDKETSGVLLAAKSLIMQQKLITLFSSRQVYKEYLAICIGQPQNGEINAPIGRHPVYRKQMAVTSTGRQAISHCQTIATNGKLSIVKIVIATGRTHQIRVHLKFKGTPVLGDSLYGIPSINQQYVAERQLLHAARIKFQHPLTLAQLDLSAPLPEDIRSFVSKIEGV